MPTPIDVLGLSILSSRKRTRDDGDANDGGDDDDEDAELAAFDDVNNTSAANGAATLERAWSPIDADEAAEAERIKRAEEAFKKLVSVRTEAEHKLLQVARERRFIRLRRSTRFVESSGHERLLPPHANEPSVAQLDATWRAAHVQQLPPPASVKSAREWIGELLVPIDIDVAIEQQRLQDTVTMALWDRTLAPLDVAQSICADYCLPQAFESAIAAQIQQSLTTIEQQFEERFAAIRARVGGISMVPPKSPSADEFEVVDRVNERSEIQNEFLSTLENLHTIDARIRREAEQEFNIDISVSAVTPHIAAERLQAQLSEAATGIPPLYEDLRVIEINFVFANRQFTDRFEWDVACVSNSPDLFAASVGADIGLPRAYVAQLALQLRRAIAAALVLPPNTGSESAANQSYFASGGSSGRSTSKLFGAPVPPPVPVPPRGVALLDETEMRRRVVRIADPVHLQPWTPYFGPLRKYDVDDGDNDMAAAGPRLRRRQTVGFK